MLSLEDISKRYDAFTLGPIAFTVDKEVMVVLGPSGSGKTTLLSLIAGLTTLDSGEITLNENTITRVPLEQRNAGLVFQEGSLFPHMTARENIEYAAVNSSIGTELAETLEITDVLDQSPATLSGGETQRVALARTLAAEPDVLLLDEPLSSLDTPTRRRLRDELHQVFDSLDIPILLVTHNQRTAMALGDRLTILRDGTIEQLGSPEEITRNPASRFVAEFTGNTNLLAGTIPGDPNGPGTVEIGPHTLRTPEGYSGQSSVTICIHPARVKIHPRQSRTEPPDNLLPGVIDRWVHEGADYRVECTIQDVPTPITVTVPPNDFEDLDLDKNTPVQLEFPPHAIHLLNSEAARR